MFQAIGFNSASLGGEAQKTDILRHLMEDFAKPALDLRPSRVGQPDIIGGAYQYLITRFAASAGRKTGEFHSPAEVSDLIARLVAPQEGEESRDPGRSSRGSPATRTSRMPAACNATR